MSLPEALVKVAEILAYCFVAWLIITILIKKE